MGGVAHVTSTYVKSKVMYGSFGVVDPVVKVLGTHTLMATWLESYMLPQQK